jgi:LysM repeat protein
MCKKSRLKWELIACGVLSALFFSISACRPNPPILVVTPSATATRVLPTLNATIVSALTAEATVALTPTETAVATTPTPTPCAPPEAWLPYQVQAGDTLFFLAAYTDIDVEALQTANCLESDFLAIGQTLFLPTLPPIAQAGSSQSAGLEVAEASECPSFFSCQPNMQVSYLRDTLSPNDPAPCRTDSETPLPSISSTGTGTAFAGRRLYFFACHFDNPQSWQVNLANSAGESVVLDRSRDFNPLLPEDLQDDVEEGGVQLTLLWSVPCDIGSNTYTLTIMANNEEANVATTTIEVRNLERPFIMVAPEVGKPGSQFEVHYCALQPNSTITLELFYGHGVVGDGEEFLLGTTVEGMSDGMGNGRLPLPSLPTDQPRNYRLHYLGENINGDEIDIEHFFSLAIGGS